MSAKSKKLSIRATYEYAPGLHTVLHYPQKFELQHEPYTCAPRTVKVKCKYEFAPGLHTTLEYVNEIVLKHYIFKNTRELINYKIVEIGPSYSL